MSTTPTGLLLPQEVLYSWWFMLLATVVAFNTVIYVGLTLAKVIPWPHQSTPHKCAVPSTAWESRSRKTPP